VTAPGPPRDQLRVLLNAVRRRWCTSVVLAGAGRSCLAASALLATVLLLVRFLAPADGTLLLIVALAAAIAFGVAGVFAWRIGRGPTDQRLARFIEERLSATDQPLDDLLVSAVEQASGASVPRERSTSGFGSLLIETAVRRLQAVDRSTIVTPRELRRSCFDAAAGAAALGVALLFASPLLVRASEAAWVALFPQYIQVRVIPGDVRLAAGQSLTIRASVTASGKDFRRFTPGLTVTAGDEQRTVPMMTEGNEFQFHFESVDRTFRYRVAAGSARSHEYTVTALFAARVERIDLRYEYPAFTDQSPREERDGGDIYAPAGTKVQVRVHTDKPIEAGQLALGGAKVLSLQRTADKQLEGELVLTTDDSYRVGLTDRDGLRSSDDTEYFIRLMDDRPPDVRILRPAGDQQITPLEEVAIQARADDDYGISRFELVYAVAGRESKVVPLNGTDGGSGAARLATYILAAEDLRVQPGDVISYYARARDIGRGKRPSETRSDMFFLEVRPFSEEFVSAQSQGMAGMAGDQIDSLVTAQKEIINATWNIERRAAAGAGQSSTDIAAIADAQAELKGRAEQMAMQNGRGRTLRFPQQVSPARQFRGGRPAQDPVGSAISAMGRALDQLQGKRPGDALAHEMAALQGLLQAQAEIRRREVAQQSGASTGGSGRQGQDLSALFDKELQRQQRTNYENRSQLEERQERNGDSALDRIRELARRQEELSRRQRDLADRPLSAEERKRQLEELTREQNTLRAQADDMARQTNSGDLRGASDRMRSAATELERQDPESAADRAGQAAEALRRLEQQMRSDSPEGRQRAAGELRMEAQQIANEQRRIASEAGRLERGTGAADADAWRRLAGEKEKLADRVDGLQRSAEQLKSGQKQHEGAPAKDTARQLEQQRIADRMREGASDMRASPGAKPGGQSRDMAAREQQIARDLDQVADRLNAGGDRAEDLSRELDQAQALRKRLDSLERRIREAEAKAASGRQGTGRAGSGQSGAPAGANPQSTELQQLREAYGKELQRTGEALSKLERGAPGAGLGGVSPENHEWSVTDQGTEAFKQDFSQWQALRKDVDSALERYEASIVARASRKSLQDRLSGGGSDRAPDAYRRLIARYYESLARKK
jgi:hypothetical protein